MEKKNFAQLVANLNNQNNRATAEPLYCVQQRRRVYGLDSSYSDKWIWLHDEDPELIYENSEDLWQELQRDLHDGAAFDLSAEGYAAVKAMDETDFALMDSIEEHFEIDGQEFSKVYYHEYYEFVCAHLTEAAADLYISQNRHNLTEPRVFVSSQHRCHEWIALVQALKNSGLDLLPALQFSDDNPPSQHLAVAVTALKEIAKVVDCPSPPTAFFPSQILQRLATEALVVIDGGVHDSPGGAR